MWFKFVISDMNKCMKHEFLENKSWLKIYPQIQASPRNHIEMFHPIMHYRYRFYWKIIEPHRNSIEYPSKNKRKKERSTTRCSHTQNYGWQNQHMPCACLNKEKREIPYSAMRWKPAVLILPPTTSKFGWRRMSDSDAG